MFQLPSFSHFIRQPLRLHAPQPLKAMHLNRLQTPGAISRCEVFAFRHTHPIDLLCPELLRIEKLLRQIAI